MIKLLLISFFFLSADCCQKNIDTKKTEKKLSENSKNKSKYVRSLRIISFSKKDFFPAGKSASIELTVKKKYSEVDSIQLFIAKQKVAALFSPPWKFEWTPSGKKMGEHLLKVIAFHKNGKKGIVSSTLMVISGNKPKEISSKVVNSFPHDKNAFTQGLFFDDGFLYEGTGQYGESEIRKVNLQTGEVLQQAIISKRYFGEGITVKDNKIFQLTWMSGEVFVYDKKNLVKTGTFYISDFSRQGWGIAATDNEIVISNGSHQLFFVSPNDFGLIRKISVCDHEGPVKNLNELEFIDGKIFANVWMKNYIIVINPKTGEVTEKINCSGLLTEKEQRKLMPNEEVLNGIAYNPQTKHLYLTGKRWPKVFEISTVEK